MAGYEQAEATQTAPVADSNSHLLGNIWSKVKSTTSDVADGAVKVGHRVADATPGVIQEGVTKAKSLDTPHNRAIAQEAGKAGAKAAVFGPHAAIAAAGVSVLEQTTGHKMPVNPMNIKGEIAKRVIDRATSTATGSDSPPVSHLHRLAEKSIANPFSGTDAPVEKPMPTSATGMFKGIKDTASKYLPHSTIADESTATQMKR
jgi:hypothetical protein